VKPVEQDPTEIFRFEYHPVDGPPRRFRVVLDSRHGALRRINERETDSGWELVDANEIDYFEFNDEPSESA